MSHFSPPLFSLLIPAVLWGAMGVAYAEVPLRWTGTEDADGRLEHVLAVLNQKTGGQLTASDFTLQDDRDLAFNHYRRYDQLVAGVPVKGKSLRVWTQRGSDATVQVEASLAPATDVNRFLGRLRQLKKSAGEVSKLLSSRETRSLVSQVVARDSNDPSLQGISWKDQWDGGDLYRFVKVKGKRGYHFLKINLNSGKVVSKDYREFPQGDGQGQQSLSFDAQVYPIYEEVEGDGTLLPRVTQKLKYIRPRILQAGSDPYAPLRTRHYYEDQMNPTLGETPEGREQGFWSMSYVKKQAEAIRGTFTLVPNNWQSGLLLQGRYATINLHPDAIKEYGSKLDFTPAPSSDFFPNWIATEVDGEEKWEMMPGSAFAGKPLFGATEAQGRVARRLPDHDPASYINDGFDEIQVYYAINTLFDSLATRGFSDPELSTRPFNAFLFNPDIGYKDNAYYTDDTINFTTYSPEGPNLARDNSTIWHELGHGLMDRLMGPNIELADTGGLSEGMADFVAELVVQAVAKGQAFPGSDRFRIINKTSFYLTNEVHDDGEAYGGTMKDFLDGAIAQFGQEAGLAKVSDVVLEAMRLTRDHPGLTAPLWFEHILFADSLGRPGVRQAGELKDILVRALDGRNFRFDDRDVATFRIVRTDTGREVTSTSAGSRNSPIPVTLGSGETATYKLKASVKGSDRFAFKFPVQVRVSYRGGPLQGAIRWQGEEKEGGDIYTLNSEDETVEVPVTATGTCDFANRDDGSCSDFVYVQVWNNGQDKRPIAKKRFYLRVKN